MKGNISHLYRSLLVNRIDSTRFVLLHYYMTSSSEYKLSDAALRTLLIITRRTLRHAQDENALDIDEYGAVVTNKSLNNITSGEVTLAIPVDYINVDDPLGAIYLIATSVSEYSYCRDTWLMDIEIPDSIFSTITGPKYGVEGIRTKFNIHDRPIIGASIQPLYTGRTLNDLKVYVDACLEGGSDLIVDDILPNNICNRKNKIDRARLICELIAEKNSRPFKTKKIGYFTYLNMVGAWTEDILHVIGDYDFCGVIVNSFTMSYGYVHNVLQKTLTTIGNRPIITCTNMGSSMLGRNPLDENIPNLDQFTAASRTGVSEVVTAKLSRFSGADAIHTGTAGAECWHPAEFNMTPHTLMDPMQSIKQSMAIAEGDMPLSEIGQNMRYLSADTIFEVSSGIGLHPLGPKSGAEAYLKVASFADKNMTHEEYEALLLFLANKYASVKESLKMESWTPLKVKSDITKAVKILKDSPWGGRLDI